jgi:hypothetical protein
MLRGKTYLFLLGFVALALTLTGTATADEGGAATIEELVEYCKGMTSLSDMVPMIHPDHQATFGMGISMMGAFAPLMAMPDDATAEEQEALGNKLSAEFEALEAKHGLREPPDDMPGADSPEGMAMRARYMFEGVDVAAYVADVEEWLGEVAGDAMGGGMPDLSEFSADSFEVDGDTATGEMGGKPVELIRDNGRWFLKIDM